MGKRARNALRKVGRALGTVGRSVVKIAKPTVNNAAKALIPRITKSLIDKSVASIAGGMFNARNGRNMQLSSAPAAMGSTVRTRAANLKASRGSSRIIHSEYISDVAARDPGNFDLQFQFGINPGNTGLFPWASKIASQFDSYKINSITFRYMPLCGTQTQGVVVMAIDYDAADAPPSSLQQMLTYKGAVQTNAWKPAAHISASSDLSKSKSHFVLTGVPPPNTDIKTYDIGNFYLAVNSIASQGAIGQLFVDYDLTLETPQTELDPPSVGSRAGNISFISDPEDVAATTITNLLGPLPAFWEQSDTAGVYSCFVPIPGYYTITMLVEASVAVAFATSLVSLQGTSLFKYFDAATDTFIQTMQFQVINPDQPALQWACSVSGQTAGTDTWSYDWNIQPLSSSLVIDGSFAPLPSLTDPRRRFGKTPAPDV